MNRGHTYILAAAIGFVAFLNAGTTVAFAAELNDGEMKITVALIYKISDFFTWPDECFGEDMTEFVVGVYGSEKMADEFRDATQDRHLNGLPIRIVEVDDMSDTEHLHVLYIAGGEVPVFAAMPDDVKDADAVLSVSESAEFMKSGGVLRIYVQNNKAKLQINVDAARRRNLKVKSDLLKVAEVVRVETD